MFILLKSGAMLNLFWLQDCFQGKHDKNIVIFYMVNGSKVIEEYDTASEAQQRVEDVHYAMDEASVGDTRPLIVTELPTENISKRRTYLIAVSSDPEDGYQEWKYIEQPDGTYKWEMMGVSKDYSYSKQDIDTFVSNINNSISNLSNRENMDVANLTNAINLTNVNLNNLMNTVSNLDNREAQDISNLQNQIYNINNGMNIMNNNVTSNISNISNHITNIYNILDWQEY